MNDRQTRLQAIRHLVKERRNILSHVWVRIVTRCHGRNETKVDHAQQLRGVLQNKLEDLNVEALGMKGEIPAEHLASLERISRAIRLSDDFKPSPGRWPPVLALLLALVLVSVLLLVRVPETEITLDAEVSDASFILTAENPLIGRTAVSQLGVSGIRTLHLSPNVIQGLLDSQRDNGLNSLRLTAITSNGMSSGAINIATLIPPSGSRVWLRYMGFPRTFRLALKPSQNGTSVILHADVHGALEIAAPGLLDKPQTCDFNKSGATFDFESGNEIMDVDFLLAEMFNSTFYTQVPIESPTFLRIEEFDLPQKSLVEPMSTILGGTLYLESLNGEKYDLRAGEHLEFTSAKGRIESLKLLDDRISFKFRGRVTGIEIGEDEASRNLMPNILEWLKARQPLSLLWGGMIFVYGIMISILHWYRRKS